MDETFFEHVLISCFRKELNFLIGNHIHEPKRIVIENYLRLNILGRRLQLVSPNFNPILYYFFSFIPMIISYYILIFFFLGS